MNVQNEVVGRGGRLNMDERSASKMGIKIKMKNTIDLRLKRGNCA